jgi:fructokinase
MFGAIEAGGTKFVCAVGTGPTDIKTAHFPTSTPDITVASVIDYFQTEGGTRLDAIGIGSFGPVDLDPSSPTYGHITSTPKVGWENYDLVGVLEKALGVAVGFETDVNTAVLGEARWGAARGLSNAVYLTIGTGVGGGAIVHGQIVHGLMHPEMGHLRVPHDLARDPFPGNCPYHADCLEGLAAGPAIQARWNAPAATLPAGHPAWELEARYLALAAVNLTMTLSPQRILFGGGVMQQMHLFPLIRSVFAALMNKYVRRPEIIDGLDEYIQPPQLGGQAGVLGAVVLAEEAAAKPRYKFVRA